MNVNEMDGGLEATETTPHRHRRRRWLIVGLVALLVVAVAVVGSVALYVGQSADPPLALPTSAAAAPVGPLEGEWTVGSGSMAGFRVGQTVLGFGGAVDGRTSEVTGTATVTGSELTAASFSVDLTTIKANGKASPQFEQSLDIARYPTASIRLTAPLELGSGFGSGGEVTVTATAELSMRGETREVTVTVSGRRDGSALEVAGSIPIDFADWGIPLPAGYGVLGSLADHGSAEFLLVLHRQG
jgi:polyisoprenoid-binding protein YceI